MGIAENRGIIMCLKSSLPSYPIPQTVVLGHWL